MKTSKKLPIDRHFDCMNSCWCRSDLCGEICLERDYPRLKAVNAELVTALEYLADQTTALFVGMGRGKDFAERFEATVKARAALAKVSQ